MPTDPKYRKMKRAAKKAGRVQKRTARATGRTVKKGSRLEARGERQGNRATTQSARTTSRGRKTGQVGRSAPKQSTRYKAMDAEVKKSSGRDMQKNPSKYTKKAGGTSKPKRRAYREAPAPGYGPNVYVNKKGERVTRKKRR
jgi:hypothetical protein